MPDPTRGHERSAGLDMLRGLLVLGVIAGHCAELIARDSFVTWFGTGIRMPLFLGLSGFLFNLDRARTAPLVTLLRRYWPRLILPWLIASVVYLLIARRLDVWALALMIVRPAYHLWFVPVMLAFMGVAAVTRRSPEVLLGWAILPSIAAMYWLGVGHGQAYPAWLPDRRFLIYPVFFFYGLWIAQRPRDSRRVVAAIGLAVIGAFWWTALHGAHDLAGEVAALLIWGVSLIYLLPNIRLWRRDIPVLAHVGRDSLFYYLWHPLAFTAWVAHDWRGWTILVPSLATLLAARTLLSRQPWLATLAGIATERGPVVSDRVPVPAAPPARVSP